MRDTAQQQHQSSGQRLVGIVEKPPGIGNVKGTPPNSRAFWRKSPAAGLLVLGNPGKPVVKVSGWCVKNSTDHLQWRLVA
jgi:hypothetical protein